MSRSKADRKTQRTERQALTQMPAEFGLQGTADIKAAEGEVTPTFSTMVYDGGMLFLDEFRFPVIVDLKGSQAKTDGQIKAFLQHNPEAPVGHVDSVSITDHIEMAGPLSVPGADRDAIIKASKTGFSWETSIEAKIPEPKPDHLEFVPAGQSVSVNNRDFNGPVIVARKSILSGFAFVGRGGGSNTSAVIVAARQRKQMGLDIQAGEELARMLHWNLRDAGRERSIQEGILSVVQRIADDAGVSLERVNSIAAGEAVPTIDELKSFATSLSVSTDELLKALKEDGVTLPSGITQTEDDDMAEKTTAATDADIKAKEKTHEVVGTINGNAPNDIEAAIARGVALGVAQATEEFNAKFNDLQASQRVDELGRQYGLDGADLDDIRAKARTESYDEKDIELAVLRASRKRNAGGFEPFNGQDGAPPTQLVINAALCQSVMSGVDEKFIAEQYGDKVCDEIQAKRWQNFGLKSIFVEYLKANGKPIYGANLDESDIQMAMRLAEQQRDIQASGNTGFSTFSLPIALGDSANKEMLRTYGMLSSQLQRVAKESSNPDYKTKDHFRVTMSGGLKKMGKNGQFESVRLNETGTTSKVEPHGAKLTISAVDIDNDDAGIFTETAQMFAREAHETVEIALATALLAGIASGFFAESKGNYFTGVGTAFSYEALAAAEGQFSALKDSNGKLVNFDPHTLTVGPTNNQLAKQLMTSSTITRTMAGGTDKDKITGTRNTLEGMYQTVKANYLGNQAVPVATGNHWMLSTNPALTSPLILAFLRGRKVPTITTWEKIPGTLGFQWDCYLAFYAGLLDDLAGILYAGQ